jgi:glycerol-3-phosphate acyltransferase PlsX
MTTSSRMKIALDAMGGDHGPVPCIEGALQAAQELNVDVILVGDEKVLSDACHRLGCTDGRLSIKHAPQVVEMHESPAAVARKKRDSSIWIATELVKSGEAQAVVSPGNTGASMVASFFVLGLAKGVERPAIATSLPTLTGEAIMLDVGANVDCTAQHLIQFAIMGNEYGQHLFKKPNPRIGLLSIGEEDSKGNEVTKEAFKLLRNSALNFKEIAGSFFGRLAYPLIATPLVKLKRRIDYAEFGGAPLLGVNGVTIICHGRSSAKAIKNAIRRAKGLAENHVDQLIQRDIEESRCQSRPAEEPPA